MRPTTLTLGTRQVGEGQPCFVLAEVASAHGGSADAALKMLEAAFKMGADGIKFQIFRSELLVVARHPGRKDFDQIELTPREWQKVLRAAKASGLTVFAEAFDVPSLRLAEEEGADGYKIHSTDMENPDFIRAVGAVRRPVFFATGGVPEDAVREALDLVGNTPVGLLHGFQTFPTPIEEIRFRELTAWKDRYRVPVGFLDHTDGGSPSPWLPPPSPSATARTSSRSISPSTAARKGSTTSRRSTPRTSTAWSSCSARPSAPQVTGRRRRARARSGITG